MNDNLTSGQQPPKWSWLGWLFVFGMLAALFVGLPLTWTRVGALILTFLFAVGTGAAGTPRKGTRA